MKSMMEKIKLLTRDKTLLYVEDNNGLRENMSQLFSKMFENMLVAEDGQDGYDSFVKNKPNIIITDINMPNMNGFKMLQKIKSVEPDSKVIILSAHDEKKHLHLAIKYGVFRYLHKPAKLAELITAVYEALLAIQEEENRRLFLNQIQNIFNYQNSIVVMMDKNGFTLSNQRFLEFFGVEDLEEFNKKITDIDSILLEHNEFLYTNKNRKWTEEVFSNPGQLFHTKVENSRGEKRHLILKSREIPGKDDVCVLSFDDVSELKLMALFDSKTTMSDKQLEDKNSVLNFMKIVKENSSKVKIHNFYRGLTIVNPAVIATITENEVVLKTAHPQLKIVHLSKFMTISSEVFPKSVVCKSVKNIDFDNQSITIDDMSFALRTSADRAFIRLEAAAEQTCKLFYKGIAFSGDVSIVDISEVSVKISISALPPGMKIDTEVKISLYLNIDSKNISILTDARVYRVDENINSYYLVLLFELDKKSRDNVKTYLVARQMELIREFKKLNIM